MREYFSTIITMPELVGQAVGLTHFSAEAPVIQTRHGWFLESVLVHEVSHVLDTQVPQDRSGRGLFSKGDWWKGNYSLDAAAVTDY